MRGLGKIGSLANPPIRYISPEAPIPRSLNPCIITRAVMSQSWNRLIRRSSFSALLIGQAS